MIFSAASKIRPDWDSGGVSGLLGSETSDLHTDCIQTQTPWVRCSQHASLYVLPFHRTSLWPCNLKENGRIRADLAELQSLVPMETPHLQRGSLLFRQLISDVSHTVLGPRSTISGGFIPADRRRLQQCARYEDKGFIRGKGIKESWQKQMSAGMRVPRIERASGKAGDWGSSIINLSAQ